MCMGVYMYGHVFMGLCVGIPEVEVGCLPPFLSTLFNETKLLIQSRIGWFWLVSLPQDHPSLLPKCWNFRQLPHPPGFYIHSMSKLQILCEYSKHFIHWAISPAHITLPIVDKHNGWLALKFSVNLKTFIICFFFYFYFLRQGLTT